MRILDLINFVHCSTTLHNGNDLSDDQRISLIRQSFPRQDLLAWFDTLGGGRIPPHQQMPAMLFRAACDTRLVNTQINGILCGATKDLTGWDVLQTRLNAIINTWLIEVNEQPPDLPLHTIGVLYAYLPRTMSAQQIKKLLTFNAYHALKILIVTKSHFEAYLAQSSHEAWVIPGHLVFQGPFQSWGSEQSYLICFTSLDIAHG